MLEGRRTIVNTGKYILMASSANFGNIFSMVLAGLFLPFLPLLPIQVLLTNLIYDIAQTGLPARQRRPRGCRATHPLGHAPDRAFHVRHGSDQHACSTCITFGVLLLVLHAGEALFRTGWFVESLVTQILMIFAVRTRGAACSPAGLSERSQLLAVGGVALTLALPFLPIVGSWFQFVRLPAPYFGFLAAAAAGFLVMIEVVKRVFFALIAPTPHGDRTLPRMRTDPQV